MTESGAGSMNLWSVPACPFQIEASAGVLEDIRLVIVDAFFSLPRGGLEVGGLLLGSYQTGRLTIAGFAPLECEHAYGPSFTLSAPDEGRLKALIARHSGGPAGARPVGWYHSHTRSEIFLSEADLAIHQRYFPERWQVALIVRPDTFQPARIGFFFREGDGGMRTQSAYREDTLEAPTVPQAPKVPVSPAPAAEVHLRRQPSVDAAGPGTGSLALAAAAGAVAPLPAPDQAAEPVPQPVTEPYGKPMELPAPRFLAEPVHPSRGWIWMLALLLLLGGVGAGFQTRQTWLPGLLGAMRPGPAAVAPPALKLNTIDRDGQLQINWDRNSPALLHSGDALLEITDGSAVAQAIAIDGPHLRTGSFTYARQTGKIDVKLTVHQANGTDVREVTSFLGTPPDHKPANDPEVQNERDALAKQAAKLKSDLNWQAVKTRKLEKDLQSMREEMKQQGKRPAPPPDQ